MLELRGVSRTYAQRSSFFGKPVAVRAVDGVSFRIGRGETLGIVGESGSGKSTTGRVALGIEPPDSGQVLFEGQPLPAPDTPAWRTLRTRMQMIFQDPLGALDRRMPVWRQVKEPFDIHGVDIPAQRAVRARALLREVGLSVEQGDRYPHELSGGQRQRVVLARALATSPDLLVCDEPVSALDVSIQAQIVNLLLDLQARLGLAMVFISHDLRVVRQVSRRVAVMYLGRIVEEGDADELFAQPLHPYTRALVSASPVPGGSPRERIVLQGDPPNPAARPSGCGFHPRCPFVLPRCRTEDPLLSAADGGRHVACHLAAPEPGREAA